MRIRQRDDRYRKKKKKQQHGSTSSHHHNQAKQLHTEPAYRRKPNPIRRYDTDVLSPVRSRDLTFLSFSLLLLFSSHIFSPASHRVFGYCCILLCGIWNSAACSVNICLPATPTDQWSGLEMTQSLSPLITDLLFFLSQCIYQWLSFFLTTDVFLSLVVLRPELHPEFQRKAGAGAALPEPAGGPTPHCGGCGLRLRLHDAPHRSCWTFTKGLTPPSPPRGLNTPLNQGDTWLYNHYPTWV